MLISRPRGWVKGKEPEGIKKDKGMKEVQSAKSQRAREPLGQGAKEPRSQGAK